MTATAPSPNGHVESVVPVNRISDVDDKQVVKATRRIAIVGTAETSLHLAPWNNPDWELWGLNGLHTFNMGNWDRWFELHTLEQIHEFSSGVHWKWLQSLDGSKPVYMQQPLPEVKGSVAFPYQRLMDRFGKYITNTVSWMLALAIDEGATEIGLYGVEMAMDDEYQHQRPSCEYFIGVARGLGITVTLPDNCTMLKCAAPYSMGYMTDLEAQMVSRSKDMTSRRDKLDEQIQNLIQQRNVFDGAVQDVNHWLRQLRLSSQG